ncbi:LytTR family transcriptional regulator DNA-binding domain-containing protein, partial [Winogradskyella sp.]
RVHRSYIISIDHIDSFSPVEIEIKKYKIPVGRKYRENVKTQLGYY